MNVEDLESLSTTDREKIAALGISDLYFMARGILRYNKLVPHVHMEPAKWFSNPVQKRIGHMAPRDHYKTTMDTISDTVRRICKRPDIRILLVNEVGENASLMLNSIRWHFENNRVFRAIYPEVIPQKFRDTTWNSSNILVPRNAPWPEPTVTAVGTGTRVVSRHFDLIKFDDMIGRDARYSTKIMKEAIEYLKYSISLLVEPEESEMQIAGTRWAHDDVYQFAIEKMGFRFLIQKAIVMGEQGPEPLFPELISMKTLQQIIETDPEQYACNYANDPYDADNAQFKAEWLQYYSIAPDGAIRWKDESGTLHRTELGEMAIYHHFDPALGDDEKNDPIGSVVVGIIPGPRIFLLSAYKKRIQPVEQVHRLLHVQREYVPELHSIESVGYQKALKYFVEPEAVRHGLHLNIKDYKPERGKSKHQRIRARLQPLFRTSSIFVRSDMTDFIDEYLKFGMTQEDHLMDALAQGPEFWREPWSEQRVTRWHRLQSEMLKDRGVTGYGI